MDILPFLRLIQMTYCVIAGAPETSVSLISQFKAFSVSLLSRERIFSSIEFLGKETPNSLLKLVDL